MFFAEIRSRAENGEKERKPIKKNDCILLYRDQKIQRRISNSKRDHNHTQKRWQKVERQNHQKTGHAANPVGCVKNQNTQLNMLFRLHFRISVDRDRQLCSRPDGHTAV